MSLELIVTEAGRAALVNAANDGTLPVRITEIGLSATAFTPTEATTALPGEITRVDAMPGDLVAADTIHVTLMDEGTAAYSLRSFALYLEDGTLFAAFSQATPVIEKTAASIALIAIDVIFADVDAASLTFGDAGFSNPQASTERLGVVELATMAEAQTGTDPQRVLTPAAARAAVLSWLLGMDGPDSGLDADKLDGQHGAWYADIPARLGFAPLPAAAFSAANVLARLLDVDGHGSGIDADKLDGHEGASYVRVTASSNAEIGGYRVYSDGFRECWGKVAVPANAQDYTIAYPMPIEHRFNSWSNVVVSGARPGTDAQDNPPDTGSTALTGFTVNNAQDSAVTIWWQAKGY